MFQRTLKLIFLLIITLSVNCLSSDIYWYIGAAFIKPANKIKELYESTYHDKVVIIAGGSGILLQKIYFSKKGDIYMPGAEYFMSLAKKKKIILKSIDLIKQVPVFAYSPKTNYKITKLSDLCNNGIKIALGDPKAMAMGKIYNKLKLKLPKRISECIDKYCIIKALNISQIQNYVKMNIVDVGLLFESVALNSHIPYFKIPEKFAVYDTAPLAILKYSSNVKKAKTLFKFIVKNIGIFKKFGYIPAKN